MYSILYQGVLPGDDVLIVGDGFHSATADLVAAMGPPFHYVATTKTRDWGHTQVNYGLKRVGGDWLILQDDDDIFLPRAFDEARTIIEKLEFPRPVIGRVKTPYRGILWSAPQQEPLDGHCLLIPNNKAKLGYLSLDYSGDQTWLTTNFDQYDRCSWADRVWTLTRPQWKLWASRVPQKMYDPERVEWVFERDDDGPTGERVGHLSMWRHPDNEYWSARVSMTYASAEERQEIADFAAWAGQGSDVWLRTTWGGPLAGYELHQKDGALYEYCAEWPPKERTS
jgi:hypothetical protein